MPTKVMNCQDVVEEFSLEPTGTLCCCSYYQLKPTCLEEELKSCFKVIRLRNGWSANLCCILRKEVVRLKC